MFSGTYRGVFAQGEQGKQGVQGNNAMEYAMEVVVIRDARQYRPAFDTFEAYCQKQWGMTRKSANEFRASSA